MSENFKQGLEWKKFSEEKPIHNEMVLLFDRVKDMEQKDQVMIYLAQFKKPSEQEPMIYLPEWEFFALVTTSDKSARVLPSDETEWSSMKTLGEEAKKYFLEKFGINVEEKEEKTDS